MEAGPRINDPIVLRDDAERSYRSRVEGLEPGLLTVARPLDLPADRVFEPGADLLATWSCPRGIAVLPVRLLDARTEGTVALWSMTITGEGWVEQRRSFVRVPASGAVTLWPRGDGPAAEPVAGQLVEISEAALRCTVDATTSEHLVAHDLEVTVAFRLGEEEFALPARIGFRRPSAHGGEHTELVVIFDESAGSADALRKQVFAQQRRTLRPRPTGP